MKTTTKIMQLISISFTMLCMNLLSGCASMSEGQCHTADWYQEGVKDGSRARGERIASHYEACKEYGVQVNRDAYRNGYQQGLKQYCVPGNGWHRGISGQSYSGFCPANVNQRFVQAYQAGRDYKRLMDEVAQLEIEKAEIEESILAEDSGLSREEKRLLLEQSKRMDVDIQNLLHQADDLQQMAYRKGW